MATMRNHEQTFNAALGAVLQTRRRNWRDRVATEMNGSIVGGGRADNLIYPESMQPVAVEAAFVGTANIDQDAIARLGKTETQTGCEIMTAVAVAIPESVQKIKGGVDGMKAWLQKGGLLNYAVYSLVKDDDRDLPGGFFDVRYPDGDANSGYIRGTAADLADLVELAATPDKKIKQTAERVGGAVRGIAALMYRDINETTRREIANAVGQPPDEHAMRVAACVWLNALILQGKLAKARPDDIRPLRECRTWSETLGAWEKILDIDYASVFNPAMKSLKMLSDHGVLATGILAQLQTQVSIINELRLGGVADVSSDMFPELATDRKTTAAFYTRMEAAELLAGLAFNLIPDNGDELKIADFACGTGALLKAAYRQVRRRTEPKTQIDMSKLHRTYMENCLHGADIQPIAAHLTAAGLAGMHPQADYKHSNIICADIRGGKTGSLDLLKSEALEDLFGASSADAVDGKRHDFSPADGTFDLCIMNPPYSRPHRGRKIFGVEGILADERKQSVKAAYRQLSKTFANMRAGMASAFCLLADRKLKKNGVLATVLPSSMAGQDSWRKFRAHLLRHYSDITVVSGCNFSAHTGMGEVLLCARKGGKIGGKLTFITLHQLPCNKKIQRPRDFVEAHEIARALKNSQRIGELKIGAHTYATRIHALPKSGDSWGAVRVISREMSTVAEKLIAGQLIKPGLTGEMAISIVFKPLRLHLRVGPSHDHIGHPDKGDISGGDRRGAFAFREWRRGDKTNLSLWKVNHKSQTRLMCEPTHRGEAVAERDDILNDPKANKSGSKEHLKKLAQSMLDLRSSLFLSRNLRMTSQKLSCATTKKPCMGGSAWAALIHSDSALSAAYCLWFNSILGLICRWQCGGRQHSGRAQMQLGDIGEMPCPVFAGTTAAAKKAVAIANKEFPRLAALDLMACSNAWRDNNRKEIDKVVLHMLGLEKKFSENDIQALREEWCREPSVHGDNKSILKALCADKLL